MRKIALIVALSVAAFAQGRDFSKVEMKVQKVAGNIYMLQGAGGNIGVSVGEDGVVVVDDQFAPLVPKIEAAIKGISPKPVRFLLNTHWHGDHTGGNAAFPATATFISHPTSKKVLEAANSARVPSETVADRRSITVGGTEIQILFLGRAHTGGDLSVYVPKEKVLFMSESYLHRIFPAMRSAYPSEWVDAIKKAEAMDATWYIPGHGFVDDAKTLKAELPVYRNAMERVIAESKRLHDAGVTCGRPTCDAATQGHWGELAEWTLFKGQLEIAIRRIYDEIDRKLPPAN